jgi:hypothetical protein
MTPEQRREYQRKYMAANKELLYSRVVAWRKANPEKVNASAKKRYAANPTKFCDVQRKHNYGITKAEYDDLLLKQNGLCAICQTDTPSGKGAWHVDHDHMTKRVRGLLCHKCNVGLGNFNDSGSVLQSAINYLAKHST